MISELRKFQTTDTLVSRGFRNSEVLLNMPVRVLAGDNNFVVPLSMLVKKAEQN